MSLKNLINNINDENTNRKIFSKKFLTKYWFFNEGEYRFYLLPNSMQSTLAGLPVKVHTKIHIKGQKFPTNVICLGAKCSLCQERSDLMTLGFSSKEIPINPIRNWDVYYGINLKVPKNNTDKPFELGALVIDNDRDSSLGKLLRRKLRDFERVKKEKIFTLDHGYEVIIMVRKFSNRLKYTVTISNAKKQFSITKK